MSRRETSRREFRNLLNQRNLRLWEQRNCTAADVTSYRPVCFVLLAPISVPLTEPCETVERSSEKVSQQIDCVKRAVVHNFRPFDLMSYK
jgi:hypothetical protein